LHANQAGGTTPLVTTDYQWASRSFAKKRSMSLLQWQKKTVHGRRDGDQNGLILNSKYFFWNGGWIMVMASDGRVGGNLLTN